MPHLVVQQRTMKRVLALVLLFALLSLSNAYVATFNIHYPTDRVCSTCFLNFATSLNWANYYPENDLATTFNATLVAQDTYTADVTFNSSQAGQTYIATVYYSAWNANETDKQWLSAVCPSVLNNLSGNNKGRMITFTLPDSDASFDIYPFFCQNEGEVRSFSMYSTQLGLDKIIYYYVPGSLLENPIPRSVDYVLQGDGFSIKGSMKTTYDFLSSQGIAPEFVVFGPGQGTPTDPWFDGGAERTREMTPWPCVPFTGGPPCGAQSGAGFQYLDFLISDALPAVQANLSLPSVGRERMAVAGWSNGGLDACVFAYMNSSIFSKGYCGSAAVWWNNGQFASVVTATPPENPIKLYLDVGGHEIGPISMYLSAAYQALLTRLELGTQLMFAHYASSPDSHQFGSWNAHTPLAFAFLYNEGRVLGTSAQGKVVVYSEAYRSFSFGATFVLPTNVSEQSKGAVEGAGSILVNLTDATSSAGNGASPASCTSSSDATSAAKITYLFVASVAALFASQIFC